MSRSLVSHNGSNASILQRAVSRDYVRVTTVDLYGVTGDVFNIKGQQPVFFMLNGCEFKHIFLSMFTSYGRSGSGRHSFHGKLRCRG